MGSPVRARAAPWTSCRGLRLVAGLIGAGPRLTGHMAASDPEPGGGGRASQERALLGTSRLWQVAGSWTGEPHGPSGSGRARAGAGPGRAGGRAVPRDRLAEVGVPSRAVGESPLRAGVSAGPWRRAAGAWGCAGTSRWPGCIRPGGAFPAAAGDARCGPAGPGDRRSSGLCRGGDEPS